MKTITRIASVLLLFMLNACAATKLAVTSVSYQSIRNEHTDVTSTVPEDARILVRHHVSPTGDLEVSVQNLTDSTMIIDRTMSFFVNSDGILCKGAWSYKCTFTQHSKPAECFTQRMVCHIF